MIDLVAVWPTHSTITAECSISLTMCNFLHCSNFYQIAGDKIKTFIY